MRRSFLAAALTFVAATSASAQIPTLFNTGVDAAGNQLPPGAIDPHYSAFQFNAIGTPGAPLGQAWAINNGYEFYYAQNPTSRWIWATPAGNQDGQSYNTMFRTTFDLTGYNPATALINVSMGVDNYVADVYLNGVSLSHSYAGFFSFDNFNITSGFTGALNTLDFYAVDQGPPAAFNAFYSSRVSPAVTATPEPATFALVGTGLFALMGVTRRRRNTQTT